LFEKKLNDREAAAAFKVGEIYARYERLHVRRRSALSSSYSIGRSGAPELAEERMNPEEIARPRQARARRRGRLCRPAGRDPGLPGRSILEALCVENQHVPEVGLPEVRWTLERIAKAARIPGTEGR
jgi:hypothetical protein